tara:strand:- start:793 stop:1401 length:609 start_codon:yes stop_codon:yes gene_type:complete
MKLLLENWRKYLIETNEEHWVPLAHAISDEGVRHFDETLAVPENLDALVKLLSALGWPREMIATHSKDSPPFSEFRNIILNNIDKFGAPKLQMVAGKDLVLDPETIADRKAKFDKYVADKEAGKDALYFRDDPSDPRDIDFSKLPPISVIETDGGYEMADGAHRGFLAQQAGADLPAYVLSQEANNSPIVLKIEELFNETPT